MLKLIPIFILAYLPIVNSYAISTDTIVVNNTKLLYQKVTTDKAEKKGLIIYMHGGVSQFKDKKQLISLSCEELLEENKEFLPVLLTEGYDIVMPIAYNEFNWLEAGGELFIDKLLEIQRTQYKHIYISGFSDGATGAYRFFYNHPEKYDGVMIFNGYPQLNNYYKKVDYFKAIGKNIIYASTTSDKIIPYEFLLIEFRRQQILNEHTYFLLRKGDHSFTAYSKADFELCVQLLQKESTTTIPGKILLYPPVDGLIIGGKLKEVYPFRKKTGKSYSMSQTEYERADWDVNTYSKLISNNTSISLKPLEVSEQTIRSAKTFDFTIDIDNKPTTVQLINWITTKTW